MVPSVLAAVNTELEDATNDTNSITITLNASTHPSLHRFVSLLNSTLHSSYDSLLVYRKPYPSLFLPHNLWGDDYVLGLLGESSWKLTSHGASVELSSQWVVVREELRFAHSVIVTSDDSSPLFVATQVTAFSLHSLDASFPVQLRVFRPLYRPTEEEHDEQQADGAGKRTRLRSL